MDAAVAGSPNSVSYGALFTDAPTASSDTDSRIAARYLERSLEPSRIVSHRPPPSRPDPRQTLKDLLPSSADTSWVDLLTEAQAKEILSLPPAARKKCLKAAPVVILALLGAGMSAADVAHFADTVSPAEASSAEFITRLKEELATGKSPGEAIAAARQPAEPKPTAEELKDLQFTHDLASAAREGFGGSSANRLRYARSKRLARLTGVPLHRLLELPFEPITRLSLINPEGLRTFIKGGWHLEELIPLSPESMDRLMALDPEVFNWMVALSRVSLVEVASLSPEDITRLTEAKAAGCRPANRDEIIDDIQPASLSYPINLGGGTILFSNAKGEHLLVSRNSNPALYNKALGLLVERNRNKVDEVRSASGLPRESELDILSLPSSEATHRQANTGAPVTIGEAVIGKLLEKYRDMLAKGQIKHDDPRAQIVRVFEARGALANGYKLLPFYEDPKGGGTTFRTYPGGEGNPTLQDISATDMGLMLNAGEINNRSLTLMNDPAVQADYQSILKEVVDVSLPGKQGLVDKLHSALTGENYINALRWMKKNGLSYEAEQMTRRDLATLTMLDPAKALDAAQKLRINSLSADFQELVDDPSKIGIETYNAATADAIKITLQLLRSSATSFRHGGQGAMDMVKFVEEFLNDKKSVESLAAVIRQVVIDARNGKGVNLADITPEQFREAMSKTYMPAHLGNRVTRFFTNAQRFGVWGSISGAAAMVTFAYKLTKGAWSANSTAMERWGAARDLYGFITVGQHYLRTGAKSFDTLKALFGGKDVNSQLAWKALGLDRTLPQIWGKDSFLPGGQTWAEWVGGKAPAGTPATPVDPTRQPLLGDGGLRGSADNLDSFVNAADDLWNDYDNLASAPERHLADIPEATRGQAAAAADNLGNIWAATQELKPLGNIASRIGLSAFRILTTVIDFVGIADIVTGALGIKRAADEGNTADIVINSVSVAAGVALTGAAVIGTAHLFATVPAVLSAAVSPLFMAGCLLSLGGFIAAIIVQAVKRHNELQDSTVRQGQWFRDLANDGLAREGWSDRLEYLTYAFAVYGNDHPDPNGSYFEYQTAEWEHFKNKKPEQGTSLYRLDRTLHKYTDKTFASPEEIARKDIEAMYVPM